MMLIKVEIFDRDTDRLLDIDPKLIVATSIGDALDHAAPDPAPNASFKVTVVQKNVTVIQ